MGKVKDRRRAAKKATLKAKRVAKEGIPHNSLSRELMNELEDRREKNVTDQREITRLRAALEDIRDRSEKSRSGVAKAAHEIAVHALGQ